MTAHVIPADRGGHGGITAFPGDGVACADGDTFSNPVTIYAGTGGTITVTTAANRASVAFVVPDGGCVPCRVIAITGVSGADNLVAVF